MEEEKRAERHRSGGRFRRIKLFPASAGIFFPDIFAHTPPGTFTQDAEEITNILLKVSDGNATLALRRLLFYMNRAGSRLGNAEQLEKAKKRLEELIEQNHETLKN